MTEFFSQNSDIFIRLGVALILGTIIGLERLFMHKEAGMKTHALVSMGASLFIIISEILAIKYGGVAGFDASRIASQVIVGIGFLGAGSIMLQGDRVKGLTTSSGLWVTAGIGMASGFGFFSLAGIATFFVLSIFTIMAILEKPIRRYTDKFD